MQPRPTARLLVIDDQQRILLFHIHDHKPLHPALPGVTVYWITPGGGVDPHETYEQAAIRELWEETGITVEQLGPWVWSSERVIQGSAGTFWLQERYFLVRVPTTTINLDNLLDYEQATHRSHRWWTAHDLRASGEVVIPGGLPQALPALLTGDLPETPIFVPLIASITA